MKTYESLRKRVNREFIKWACTYAEGWCLPRHLAKCLPSGELDLTRWFLPTQQLSNLVQRAFLGLKDTGDEVRFFFPYQDRCYQPGHGYTAGELRALDNLLTYYETEGIKNK